MADKNKAYQGVFDHMYEWLKSAAKEDVKYLNSWVDKVNDYINAAEDVSINNYGLSVESFKHDLLGFYRHYQADTENSLYLDTLGEGMWQHLANMTDQTQIEWQELLDDIEHDGVYKTGDVIGFGRIICNGCGRKVDITHASTVIQCPKCGANEYSRQMFEHNL